MDLSLVFTGTWNFLLGRSFGHLDLGANKLSQSTSETKIAVDNYVDKSTNALFDLYSLYGSERKSAKQHIGKVIYRLRRVTGSFVFKYIPK